MHWIISPISELKPSSSLISCLMLPLRGNISKLIFSKIWTLFLILLNPQTTSKAIKELPRFSSTINDGDRGEISTRSQSIPEPKPNRPFQGRARFNPQNPSSFYLFSTTLLRLFPQQFYNSTGAGGGVEVVQRKERFF